jgi:hypothetical protein
MREECWNELFGWMVPRSDSQAFPVALYPGPAGRTHFLECVFNIRHFKEKKQNRMSCKWDILHDYVGEKTEKINTKGIIIIKLFSKLVRLFLSQENLVYKLGNINPLLFRVFSMASC